MRSATIVAGLATVVWLSLVWLGVSAIEGIAAQNAPGYPNWAQIVLWVGFPAIVSAVLIFSIYFFGRVRQSATALGVIAALSLGVILPFIMTFAGGV